MFSRRQFIVRATALTLGVLLPVQTVSAQTLIRPACSPTVDLLFETEAFSPVSLWAARVLASLQSVRSTRIAATDSLDASRKAKPHRADGPPVAPERIESATFKNSPFSPPSAKIVPELDSEGAVRLTFDGPVATITLDRPPVNAWSITMFRQAVAAAREARRRPEVRLVILKATGRLFGVGGDIKAVAQALEAGVSGFFQSYYREASEMFLAFENLRHDKPLVTLAHGTAVGGHLGLGMGGILVVSSNPSAKYAMPEIRLGMFPDAVATHRLPRRVGLGFALFMSLLGRELSGDEARFRGVADVSLMPEDFAAAEADLRTWAATSASSLSPYGILKRLRAFEKNPPDPRVFLPPSHFNQLFAMPDSYEEMLPALSAASAGEGAQAALAQETLRLIEEPLALFFQAAYNAVHLGLMTDARQTIVRDLQMSSAMPRALYAARVRWITVHKRKPELLPRAQDDHARLPHPDLSKLLGFNAPIVVHKNRMFGRLLLPRAKNALAAKRGWDAAADVHRRIRTRFSGLLRGPRSDLQRNTFENVIDEVIVSELGAQLDLGLLASADIAPWIQDLMEPNPPLDERILTAFDLNLTDRRARLFRERRSLRRQA